MVPSRELGYTDFIIGLYKCIKLIYIITLIYKQHFNGTGVNLITNYFIYTVGQFNPQ